MWENMNENTLYDMIFKAHFTSFTTHFLFDMIFFTLFSSNLAKSKMLWNNFVQFGQFLYPFPTSSTVKTLLSWWTFTIFGFSMVVTLSLAYFRESISCIGISNNLLTMDYVHTVCWANASFIEIIK